ncbi:MAG: hypothetical protein NTZ78_05980 [Candidatus Aureabacteria bacterium]|nr:hypothetical protein [Candidatus Auribacterota bacterium]
MKVTNKGCDTRPEIKTVRGRFLNNSDLARGGFILNDGNGPPLGDNHLPLEGYRYSFKGPVRQCRLCVHHMPSAFRASHGGRQLSSGAFRCAVMDFHSSSGYVVVVPCDRWELADNASRKNRGKAWLRMRPVSARGNPLSGCDGAVFEREMERVIL